MNEICANELSNINANKKKKAVDFLFKEFSRFYGRMWDDLFKTPEGKAIIKRDWLYVLEAMDSEDIYRSVDYIKSSQNIYHLKWAPNPLQFKALVRPRSPEVIVAPRPPRTKENIKVGDDAVKKMRQIISGAYKPTSEEIKQWKGILPEKYQ